MMRFMRFSRQGTSLAKPAGRAAAILFAGLAGGCSAHFSGFDFPGFALNDDPKPQQTASAAGRGNPSYLGNDGYGSGGGDNAPRTYRENGVSSQSLPDASPPSSYASSDRRYDSGPSNTNANNGRYDSTANTTYSTDRRYATAPTTTNSTNRYDPQPQPSLSNPGDQVEVQLGDTLYGLSRRHRVSVAELMQVNSLTNPNLQPGQKLYLPQGYAANRSQPAPVQTASVQAPPASVPGDLDAKYRASYTMRQGDSPLRHLALVWRVRRRVAAGQRHHGRTRREGRRRTARSGGHSRPAVATGRGQSAADAAAIPAAAPVAAVVSVHRRGQGAPQLQVAAAASPAIALEESADRLIDSFGACRQFQVATVSLSGSPARQGATSGSVWSGSA